MVCIEKEGRGGGGGDGGKLVRDCYKLRKSHDDTAQSRDNLSETSLLVLIGPYVTRYVAA